MHLLKQSTAATVIVGPVLDASGVAVTTAVVGDFRLAKEGSSAVLSGATVTHDANGYYLIALTSTNTNTVGRLAIYSNNTAQSMGTTRFMVLLPSVYDALVTNAVNATGGLPAATAQITALAGAISTYSGGAVASVTGNVGGNVAGSVNSVVTRVTANTDQWNGVTVTGMPMPTYTQPAGFLGATFPTTVASTTNITQASGVVLAATTHTGARIPNVTLVDTTTVNSDMRGTDNALLAANYTAPPSAATNATAVRSELSTELSRIDATIGSRSTLTAGGVRTELATELERIDATISSRLASVSYVAPDNATIGAIATNLVTVNNNVLSRLASTSYVAPLSASETRAALGLASANLDTQLADIPTVTEFDARTLTSANYATATNQTAIKAVTDKLNTTLVVDGLVWKYTVNALSNAPGGGGGGSATIENQELILANLDNITGAVSAAVARLQLETQITGFPATICRGSDYDTALESEIRLQLLDLNNDPITEIGGTPVDEITWLFGLGTDRQPRLVEGACSWDDTTDELVIELAATDTSTTPLGSVTWQIGAKIGELVRWLGGGTTRIVERQFTV